MAEYFATIAWSRGDQVFLDNAYSRGHTWSFDGGAVIAASSSPDVVPVPRSVAANVDPEEAFVAALASCHMLFFLAIAAARGFVIDEYVDHAFGVMSTNADGKPAITRVTLRPHATFSGASRPSRAQLEAMHRLAHEECFIASSVRSEVVTEIPPG